ncbi:glycosyltransferase family 2 protein [Ancylobacter sp.]|uniref:glycosyltransferase family 2 protein n=1 Tax=Ancylobacter sp. TaxID=1872567 RepID=UPI003D0BA516
MPALDAARFIEAALGSLLRERDSVALDIVVVDDGSTDDTCDIVQGMARSFPEIRLVPNAGRGIPAGRNTGLAASRPDSRFITFLDSDDLSYPGRIARQRELLATQDYDAVYGLLQLFRVLDEATQAPAAGFPTRVMRGPYLQSSMYRADAIRSLGPFDENFRQGEDTEFVLRAIDRALRLHREDAIAAYYRRHDKNTTRNTEEVQRFFRLATMRWAMRRRVKGKVELPPIFAELFEGPANIELDMET